MGVLLLAAAGFQNGYLILAAAFSVCACLIFHWLRYRHQAARQTRIMDLTDSLEETWYAAEVLPSPREPESRAYHYALKRACKAMNERLEKSVEEQQDYREYIESFAHEIKVPISALSLAFDNMKDYELKKETDRIYNLVEQMLYYARSENTEKDYFVRRLSLPDVVHDILLKYRRYFLDAGIELDIRIKDTVVFTDEKWLGFILSQIIQNSVKYFDKPKKRLSIYSESPLLLLYLWSRTTAAASARLTFHVFSKRALPGRTAQRPLPPGWGCIWRKRSVTGWDWG